MLFAVWGPCKCGPGANAPVAPLLTALTVHAIHFYQIHTWRSINACVSDSDNWICCLIFRAVSVDSVNDNNSYHDTVHQLISNHNGEEESLSTLIRQKGKERRHYVLLPEVEREVALLL